MAKIFLDAVMMERERLRTNRSRMTDMNLHFDRIQTDIRLFNETNVAQANVNQELRQALNDSKTQLSDVILYLILIFCTMIILSVVFDLPTLKMG